MEVSSSIRALFPDLDVAPDTAAHPHVIFGIQETIRLPHNSKGATEYGWLSKYIGLLDESYVLVVKEHTYAPDAGGVIFDVPVRIPLDVSHPTWMRDWSGLGKIAFWRRNIWGYVTNMPGKNQWPRATSEHIMHPGDLAIIDKLDREEKRWIMVYR